MPSQDIHRIALARAPVPAGLRRSAPSGCSPEPCDIMAIYALYQSEVTP